MLSTLQALYGTELHFSPSEGLQRDWVPGQGPPRPGHIPDSKAQHVPPAWGRRRRWSSSWKGYDSPGAHQHAWVRTGAGRLLFLMLSKKRHYFYRLRSPAHSCYLELSPWSFRRQSFKADLPGLSSKGPFPSGERNHLILPPKDLAQFWTKLKYRHHPLHHCQSLTPAECYSNRGGWIWGSASRKNKAGV